MLPNQLNKLLALLLIRMVQPTASIHHVILLQHPQSTPIGRRMRKYKHLPTIISRMRLQNILKPIDLLLINRHLMRGIHGITKDSGAHAHQQSLVGHLAAELGSLLLVRSEVRFEILLVGFELVEALEVVVASHDIVGDMEAGEEFGCHFVALGGACEQLRIALGVVTAILRLAQIAE